MFTDEELERAVLKFLQSSVTTERTERGIRDVLKAKTELYELIGAVFLMRPRALFAVCWMASNNLRALVAEQLVDLEAIMDAAPRASESSQRVTSTSDLYNAEAALLSLTAAFSARESGVRGSIGPSVQRFAASVDRFVRDELVKNTVDNGVIVRTGEELRILIQQTWARVRARHDQIQEQVDRLEGALDEFSRVRLPDTVVGGIMARIQQRLAEITSTMESSDAPAKSREALLELSAMRVLLKQASTFAVPALEKVPLTGDAVTCALTSGNGRPASIMGTVSGPFYYGAGTVLTYSVGDVTEQVALPRHSAASLRSRAMLTWVPPTGVCALYVNGTRQELTASGWASGPDAAAALVALAGVEALWHPEVGQLELRTEEVGASASLAFAVETDEQAAFVLWYGSMLTATSRPVSAAEAVQAFGDQLRVFARVARVGTEERIELVAHQEGPALAVQPGAGATALGLPLPSVAGVVGTLSAPVRFAERGVSPGDQLVFEADPVRYVVTEVGEQALRFVPPRAPASALRYSVRDGAVADYLRLREQLEELERDSGWNVTLVDQSIGRLVRGARYGGELATRTSAYHSALLGLRSLCDAYKVEREPAVEEMVRALVEHGFDRAKDLFVSLQLEAFFSLDAEGASYRSWVTRNVADATSAVVPVSRDGRDPTMRWRTLAVIPTQYDPEG